MSRAVWCLVLLGAVPLAGGCDRIPALTFAVDDGGVGDVGAELPIDGGCPGSTPGDAAVCCGSIACSGDCAGRCPECESTCASGTFCCAKMNNIMCRQVGMPCN
jgi:hypothetical protein